ncbi:LexA family protein [Pseudomonas fluorescens]|uniref:LexA family protein n=1 Tax=Pseudomonas fluorescens TaxID=294 RepID=UPI003D231A4A
MARMSALLKGLAKMEIGRAIRDARKAKGMTLEELAHQVGTDSGNLSRLERGIQGASQDLLIKILDALGLPLSSALAAGSMRSNVENAHVLPSSVPVISWVQAGQWTEVMSSFTAADAEDWVACPVAHGPRTFVLRVRGESMFNPHARRSFREGDLIYVDPDKQSESGSLVVVQLEDHPEATFKQLIIEGDRKYLKAINPAWPEPILPINGNATICGVVIFKGEFI